MEGSLSPDLATELLFTLSIVTFIFVSHISCRHGGLDTDTAGRLDASSIASSARRCPEAVYTKRYYIISKQLLFSRSQISLAVRLTGSTETGLTGSTEAGFRGGSTNTRAGNLEQTREDGGVFLGVKVLKAASMMHRGSFVCLKPLKAKEIRLDEQKNCWQLNQHVSGCFCLKISRATSQSLRIISIQLKCTLPSSVLRTKS